jgi:hypothetical protein
VTNGAIAQQTFEVYAVYIIPQLHSLIAHSNPRSFTDNLEGYGGGASEDDVVEGAHIIRQERQQTARQEAMQERPASA